jgi:hypothetical protein
VTGTRTYAYTYTDCEGNTGVWSFVYTIIDNTLPSVTCNPGAINFNGEQSIALNANSLVTATDNCGIQSISLSPASILATQVGQNVQVIATVMDINGNTNTCTSIVAVGGLPEGWNQQPEGVGVLPNAITLNTIQALVFGPELLPALCMGLLIPATRPPLLNAPFAATAVSRLK